MSRIWSRDWTSDKTLLQIVCPVIVSHHPDDRMTTPSTSGPLLEDPEPVMEMSVFLLAASGSYLSSPLLWLIWGRPGSSPQLPFPARPGPGRQDAAQSTQQRIWAFHSSRSLGPGSLTCCWWGLSPQQPGGLQCCKTELSLSVDENNSDLFLCPGDCFTKHVKSMFIADLYNTTSVDDIIIVE